jgi:hypothetical protein
MLKRLEFGIQIRQDDLDQTTGCRKGWQYFGSRVGHAHRAMISTMSSNGSRINKNPHPTAATQSIITATASATATACGCHAVPWQLQFCRNSWCPTLHLTCRSQEYLSEFSHWSAFLTKSECWWYLAGKSWQIMKQFLKGLKTS